MAIDLDDVDEDTQFVVIEELVAQAASDASNTARMDAHSARAGTRADWPPEPPLPAEVELAQGTETNRAAVRNASFHAIPRRPTTSSDDI